MDGTRGGLPELTAEERLRALEKAAAARHERAELKAAIKRGEVPVAEVLASDAEAARRMRVLELIGSVPGYGPRRARKLMARLGISESRRVRGLGKRQRAALLAALCDGEGK